MWISVMAAVAALIVVSYFIVAASFDPNAKYIGEPVGAGVMNALTGVSASTLTTVGAPSNVIAPVAVSGSPLTSGGKTVVLYIGGDFCPYCAAERWSLIVALSQFGNFSGLQYMLSSSTDVNKNSPTFTFSSSTYSSKYVVFQGVEEYDRSGNLRQQLTTQQSSLLAQYDTCSVTGKSGSIPFVDIGNQYVLNCGAQFNPSCNPATPLCMSGKNWTAISSQLDNPNNPITQVIVGSANYLITAICKADGGHPSSVCDQAYANQTLSYTSAVGAHPANFLAVPSRPAE